MQIDDFGDIAVGRPSAANKTIRARLATCASIVPARVQDSSIVLVTTSQLQWRKSHATINHISVIYAWHPLVSWPRVRLTPELSPNGLTEKRPADPRPGSHHFQNAWPNKSVPSL